MEKEVSCINARVILDYVKEHNNGDCSGLFHHLDPEIDDLKNPEQFLTDANNWMSCKVASALYQRAADILKDDMVAYHIAKYAVEKTSLGYTQGIIVKAFWSTKMGLKNLQKINDKWNRSKRVELVDIKRNEAVVRLHWDPSMAVTKHLCLMNQGSYTFMPLIWGGRPLTLEEHCCYFSGAPYCEYRLRWPFRNRFHEIFSRFFTSKSVLMDTIKEMEADKRVIEQKYEEVHKLNVDLNYKIRQLLAVQETGKAILAVLDLDRLLTVIMNILSSVCRINRAMIMLANEEEGCLEYIHGVGFEGDVPDEVMRYRVPLDRVSNILARVASTGRAEYVSSVESSGLRRGNVILTHGKPAAVYVVPLITRAKVIGVIATDATDGDGIPRETRETLEIFGPQIAIAIQNARLYRALQEQMIELKKSHALLSRAEKFSFLGNLAARLAHEIKNPLTAIGTFIQMLPYKYDDEEFRKDFHSIALEETNRVNNLITELLDMVKTKKPHFEHTDLHGLIEKMILLVSPQSKGKHIDVACSFGSNVGQVLIDSEKMKQVILNLLSNAITFTPERGRIRIVTSTIEEKGVPKSVRVEISDTGMGILPSIINKIFDPYFTTIHKSDMHNGTGLGLFIAHQNMQDHGGAIEVQSTVNEGTTFLLTIPYAPPSIRQERAHEGIDAN